MLLHHSATGGAPVRQDCIEMSAKSEVVTVCSWQFEGLTHPQAFSPGIAVSNDDNKSRTTNYWPSSPSYSTTTTSPTTTPKNDAFRSGRHQRDDAARGLQIVSVPGAGRLGVQVLTGRGSDPERDSACALLLCCPFPS